MDCSLCCDSGRGWDMCCVLCWVSDWGRDTETSISFNKFKASFPSGVDWWAFGILAYELRCGYTPFRSSNPDPYKRQKEIEPKVMAMQHGKVEFPGDRQLQDDFKDLIRRLLMWKSSERLGVISKVSAHPFFSRVDTEKVLRKGYNPPFKVDQRSPDTNISVTVGDICFDEEFADF